MAVTCSSFYYFIVKITDTKKRQFTVLTPKQQIILVAEFCCRICSIPCRISVILLQNLQISLAEFALFFPAEFCREWTYCVRLITCTTWRRGETWHCGCHTEAGRVTRSAPRALIQSGSSLIVSLCDQLKVGRISFVRNNALTMLPASA